MLLCQHLEHMSGALNLRSVHVLLDKNEFAHKAHLPCRILIDMVHHLVQLLVVKTTGWHIACPQLVLGSELFNKVTFNGRIQRIKIFF